MLRCYGSFICFFFCLRFPFRQRRQRMAEVLPQSHQIFLCGEITCVLLSDSILP